MTEDCVAGFLTSITSIAEQLRGLSAYEADMLFSLAREAVSERKESDLLVISILSGVRLGHRSAVTIGNDLQG